MELPAGGKGRLFVMRGDENISEWEERLALAIRLYKLGERQGNDRVYGALYHLAQVSSPAGQI